MSLHKMPLDWHEKNLKNMQAYLQLEYKRLEDLQKSVSELVDKCEKLDSQINKAKRLNITEFDGEEARFNKNI